MDENGAIGINNQLPWRLKNDLKNFKEITSNHHVLLGRKTYDSIGRPLPNREMLVITRSELNSDHERLHYFKEVEAAINFAKQAGESELFVIGGSSIYELLINKVDKIYLSIVQTKVQNADAFMCEFKIEDFEILNTRDYPVSDADEYAWKFLELERKS